MSRYISDYLREKVAKRAGRFCEYCFLHEDDTFFSCQIDHIISIKHGGQTAFNNLAFTCIFCNRNKGSDIGSIILSEENFTRFYNPRIDKWTDHFDLDKFNIHPKTNIGYVTSKILILNDSNRLLERKILYDAGRYPLPEALKLMDRINS